ncbi:hypothetical protein JCGZ_11240 [Jatropha curcas]|uniref:PHD-type domain-containing protein n=1 Tax=Jatropha curcas TaxID=180498 RepID=A0A067KE20_JATCU|nr:DDT domain-containing protein PTM [Jatropha curcas]KDP34357.1 hypothetical protein JCGZ_11240 [Jatropha curcas]
MEPTEVKKRGRGRPRKRWREEDEIDKKVGFAVKKQFLEMRWKPLVGRYVLKEFNSNGVYLGKIVYYDSGLYRVDYEDGDCEDLESSELRDIILGDDYFDDDLTERRKRLDQLVLEKISKNKKDLGKEVADSKTEVDRVETSALTELSGEVAVEDSGVQDVGDADSSSVSCENSQDDDLEPEAEVPIVPPLPLPMSSGTVGVPEEYVSHLFSVYGFLRSFNIRLFLSPFTLDDLVGAINCQVQNTLMDAIHVSLMRALRRHLETLSSDGSELASKCLRSIDWGLLDSVTWPVYLVHYFTIMGYSKGPEWKGFCDDFLKREYYSLPVTRKLTILQILCDDVLDCAEIRTEIDMREESEVGIDPDAVATNFPENGPRRVHPRYSKTSACKDREAMEIITQNHGNKSSCDLKYLGSQCSEEERDAASVGVDGNSDECRLCGMDGTLLCCDGCPSAYHSRCIGVVKMYIPEGPWYCPECTINKLGPTVIVGTSLRGAEIFGVDIYGQVFLGTCNHLLVLKASVGAEPYLRYYNQKDIPKFLQVLSSSVQHRSLYLEISKAIAEYWRIPQSAFSPFETMGGGLSRASTNEDEKSSTLSVSFTFKASHKVENTVKAENELSSNISDADKVAVSCLGTSVNATFQADAHGILSNGDVTHMKNCDLINMKLPQQIKVKSADSFNQQIDPSDLAQNSFMDRSSVITTCTSTNSDGSHAGDVNANLPASIFSQSKEGNRAGFGRIERNLTDNFVYMGTCFKPYAYINHYVHGDFAASAAANLAVLSSEEIRVSEAHKSGNARKAISDILLQAKAFSTSASRFFWPSSEKKLIEVPRERCGWCYSCKVPSNSRRGCMLNSAALTATKGTMKILSSFHPIMSREGSLPSISTYILYLGEILCGLTVGPFVSASYRKQWRKRVEDASTCSAIKVPLLELEHNIRVVALSGDWTKAMDDWLVDSPVIQNAVSTSGTTQKRGPGGKRHKRQSGISDIRAGGCDDKSFIWWRGGKLLKLVFHKAILPRSVVKKAARQGGSTRISGVYYVDDPELSKRSRQLVWRAAVEKSKNTSQLALQVRYLDLHVRWSDLVHPEQNLLDGKGPETEASIFRNASICGKKVEGNKIMYGVAFGNQKHLPSRIMKNIIELEQGEDVKEKYWFSEMHVPLYLIKEYEERVGEIVLPSAKKSLNELSELQRRQLKASRKDVFLYLTYKRDKLDRCSCASCHNDVLLRNTVKCSACQGYCHKHCTTSSTIYTNEEVEFSIACKQCYSAKVVTPDNSNDSPTTPLPLQRRESQNVLTVNKTTRIKLHTQPLMSVKTQESSSETKQITSASSLATKNRSRSSATKSRSRSSEIKQQNKVGSWGVIWKKKNVEDTGIDFRCKNILLKGGSERLRPDCHLCKKPYNRELMYIYCEKCKNWFHADAVKLDESNLPNVVGFKCCRCRKVKSPKCPYDDCPEVEKPVGHESHERVLKKGNVEVDSDSGPVAESKEYYPNTPMFPKGEPFIQDDDPLLFSLSRVEQIKEDNSGPELEWNATAQGPQKLPVRRHAKPQVKTENIFENNHNAESSVPLGGNNLLPEEELPSCGEWDVSANSLEGDILFDYESLNYEDMEFEPQTYFSFTELLPSDDGAQVDGFDASGNQSCAVSQDGFPEQFAVSISGDGREPVKAPEATIDAKPCKMCLHSDPVPDLSCDICNLVIHRHCSPWVELSSAQGTWTCGRCREWQ